ncbi:tRNA (adenosine(37)-N6)-threonylcarbamoyltransferase complex ATPase subunit type 1 TsaE [Flavonifractor sp. An92]|uniref:tRNA (adenosine(37)-N6)-threonylcarbamoyltransferase complex ATPase subunit type 1 TsaE n=1 Tax=Flavonifractor sp. An92 TaxID=1965666 RepID=UPI000B376473|nr:MULTISPECIES: tRNA (adenosine(37)-N6)-threonylcarbamoyltransferase complex ATPase subunit type 1 TsaE [unclassified Flavonifractor]OUN02996.1 tRNA (adenosine(37)-N6)-threonylcarbamoyltransferase complex ATPase subunit type 1 TsaE [Flavonifractor sp. An92]OUQ18746.1 tRNA (adenosine(37)-N6)-threonylcarbamoyltransferase complex ATPase subunit type 1 TsaE [Flavonifractor sp. An135]
MEYLSNSEAETEALGEALAGRLTAGDVIAFSGDLGAGKTAFTRGLARGLGVTERVTSPTFTIVNEYLGGRLPLFHFDLYRLSSAEELFDIGWEDYLDRGGVCAVEWSENGEGVLEDPIRVDIRRGAADDQRVITITGERTV